MQGRKNPESDRRKLVKESREERMKDSRFLSNNDHNAHNNHNNHNTNTKKTRRRKRRKAKNVPQKN